MCDGNLPKTFSSFQEIYGSVEVGRKGNRKVVCVFKNLWKAKMKTLDICKGDRVSTFLLSCPTQFIIRRKGRDSRRMTL